MTLYIGDARQSILIDKINKLKEENRSLESLVHHCKIQELLYRSTVDKVRSILKYQDQELKHVVAKYKDIRSRCFENQLLKARNMRLQQKYKLRGRNIKVLKTVNMVMSVQSCEQKGKIRRLRKELDEAYALMAASSSSSSSDSSSDSSGSDSDSHESLFWV